MFFLQEGFTYRNFLMDLIGVFFFIVWFWLLITVFADLFRRHDISGWIKAIWVIALIVFSYIAILAYLIFQGRGMAERNVQRLRRRVMSLGAWLVSAPQMKSKSSNRLRKQDRSATPNLHDYVPGSSSNEHRRRVLSHRVATQEGLRIDSCAPHLLGCVPINFAGTNACRPRHLTVSLRDRVARSR